MTDTGQATGVTRMPVKFNHAIVYARDSRASAAFLAELLGLSGPTRWGPFHVVTTDNDGNVDFMNADGDITPQHYAFLVGETDFEEILTSIVTTGAEASISRVQTQWRFPAKSVLSACMPRLLDSARFSMPPSHAARGRSEGED